MLVQRLWQLSEAGDPALLLGRPTEGRDRVLFERLLEQGVLRHAGQQATWDTCEGCDCGRDERPIRWLIGRPTAVCITDRAADLVLTEDDLLSFEVVIPELVLAAAEASGFAERPEEVAPGIWRLGRGQDGRALHLIPTRQALHRPGLIGSLRQTEPTQDIIVLGPSLAQGSQTGLDRQGIYFVPLANLAGTVSSPHSLALELTNVSTAANGRVRLHLQLAKKTVIFDGMQADVPARQFSLLHLLAQRVVDGNPILSVTDIKAELFSSATSDAQPQDLVRQLRTTIQRLLRAANDLIENRFGLGYALALNRSEISIDP